jgi:hypothetical protein
MSTNLTNLPDKTGSVEGVTTPPLPKMTPFWGENPNILFNTDHIFDFYPCDDMGYNEKLNAITRLVIFLTVIALFMTEQRFRLLFISAITLGCIWGLHQYHENQQKAQEGLTVQISSPGLDYLDNNHIVSNPEVFQQPTSANPFSNVLMSDYDYNVDKLPAPSMSNSTVRDMITQNAVKLVEEANPGQPGISEKLFRDMNEQLNFEQSMRQFYSNPATTIPNDQGAFAEFCYGSMISCKEGNLFACARNTSHYTNY